MNNYLIPANSKKSMLIFGLFNPADLWIVGLGAAGTLITMLAIPGDSVSVIVVKLLPIALGVTLVVPVPFYHNVVTFLKEAVLYLLNQKQYKWRGWCATSEFNEQQK